MTRRIEHPITAKAGDMGTPRIGAVDVLHQPPRSTECRVPSGEGGQGSGQQGCPLGAPEEALAAMDEAGIAVALVSQCKQWSCERQWMCVDTRLEDVARFVRFSPRFVGLTGYNPFDVTESLREMEAAARRFGTGFRGSYLNAASFGLRLSDPRFYPLFAKAAEIALPSVVQVPLAEPELARCVERIGRDFPELSLALVHPRPGRELFDLGERFEGLAFVLDTASLAWIYSHERRLLDQPSVLERLLWGSNGAPLAATVAEARQVALPEESLERILHSNAVRYFSPPDTRSAQALDSSVTTAER